MSSSQREETDLQLLFTFVVANNVKFVEQWLKKKTNAGGGGGDRRATIRTELDLRGPIAYNLRDCRLVPPLLAIRTTTVSALHLAALLGHNDILVNLLDWDVPVDAALVQSGGTPLQFASLAGHLHTVSLLIDVYKADVGIADKYGWTALHYAGVEGRLPVVKALVTAGCDVSARDHDGTTAAYRARAAHHADVLHFLCTLDGAGDLLRVDGSEVGADGDAARTRGVSAAPECDAKAKKAVRGRAMSDAAPSGGGGGGALSGRSMTLPVRMRATDDRRSGDVRRLIQRELERAFESDYEQAVGCAPPPVAPKANGGGAATRDMLELRSIVRDELTRYKRQQGAAPSGDGERNNNKSKEEEDLYATLAEVASLPPAPDPPALPPRNSLLEPLDEHDDDIDDDRTLQLTPSPAVLSTTVEMLNEALLTVVVAIAGPQWRRLARELPIDVTPAASEARIRAIERRHPRDERRQAAVALAEWRINQRGDATMAHMAAALRRSGMRAVAQRVEEIEQEYLA